MNRTLSIGSRVPPAVTSTFRPRQPGLARLPAPPERSQAASAASQAASSCAGRGRTPLSPEQAAVGGHGEDRDLVVVGVEADVGARDVVYHDRVQPLPRELLARELDRPLAVLGREADDRLAVATAGDEAREHVPRGLELELQASAACR